jgi:hypothetical protein
MYVAREGQGKHSSKERGMIARAVDMIFAEVEALEVKFKKKLKKCGLLT